jgi:hypothetical protein
VFGAGQSADDASAATGEYATIEPAAGEPETSSGSRSAAGLGADLFGAAARAGNGGSAGSSGSGAAAAAGASATGRTEAGELTGAPLGAPAATYSWSLGQSNGGNGVIVPPAESLADENRLPIFEAVESDWFRHGRNAFSWSGSSSPEEPERAAWTSPADEGWRAAETVSAPSSGGTTSAGLPKRVPQANLVPGAAAATTAPAPTRSAAVTRDRFANFQRGVREARAAASGGTESAGEDETS